MSDITIDDSVIPADLPPADAYTTYNDGAWPTTAAVHARFPDKHLLELTTGLGVGNGIDIEVGNAGWSNGALTAGADWIAAAHARGVWRPCGYIQLSDAPQLEAMVEARGLQRNEFRLMVAHWTGIEHICTVASCGVDADGTQYANFPTYDLGVALPDFFGTPQPSRHKVVAPRPQPKETDVIDVIDAFDKQWVATVDGASNLVVWEHEPNATYKPMLMLRHAQQGQTPRFQLWKGYLSLFVKVNDGSVVRCYTDGNGSWTRVTLPALPAGQ